MKRAGKGQKNRNSSDRRNNQGNRGRGRNINVRISDNGNGWATLQGPGLVAKSMDETVRSEDLVTGSKMGLVQAAVSYNETASSFPASLIAKKFGFNLWRFKSHKRRKNAGGW